MIQNGTVEFPTYGYFPGAFATVADCSPRDFAAPYAALTPQNAAASPLGALPSSPASPTIPGLPDTVMGIPTTWGLSGSVGAASSYRGVFSGSAQARRKELSAARAAYRSKRAAILSSKPRIF
ncbi:hypothetical protein OY671_011580 [Metschnikowia pulcherrima]|nr:hypothetical protein OY671_011580 [Metschnikowia pulcherrima]